MYGEKDAYLILLEFPEEKEGDPDLDWLQGRRWEIERFCDECCVKVGMIYLLPEPYFPVLDRFLREVGGDYRRRGYSPLLKILQTKLPRMEYVALGRLILDRIFAKLENCLMTLTGKKLKKDRDLSSIISKVSKDLVKANESVLLFQLDKVFPDKVNKLHDMIDILGEKVAEHEAHALGPVVVTEIEG